MQSQEKKIIDSLEMVDCKVVLDISNNANIYYSILPMLSSGPMQVLCPLIRELFIHGVKAKCAIVLCQTYDRLLQFFRMTALELG